jgi:hypothetical protein
MFMIHQILEKIKVQNLLTCLLFTDHEKAYDSLNHVKVWRILKGDKISSHEFEAITNLYKRRRVRLKYMKEQI